MSPSGLEYTATPWTDLNTTLSMPSFHLKSVICFPSWPCRTHTANPQGYGLSAGHDSGVRRAGKSHPIRLQATTTAITSPTHLATGRAGRLRGSGLGLNAGGLCRAPSRRPAWALYSPRMPLILAFGVLEHVRPVRQNRPD